MIRIVHVCTDLEPNGAQGMLLRLLGALDRERFASEVVSLAGEGALAPRLRELGVRVHAVGLTPSSRGIWRLGLLHRRLGRLAQDVTHTWLYHANLVGGLSARIGGGGKVLWAVRHGELVSDEAPATTRAVARACARLAHRLPDHIVCCAESALRRHAAAGYPESRMSVVPNGFDLERLRPSPEARAALRRDLGIPEDAPVVGMAARLNPVKDHRTFVAASRLLASRLPEARFVLCGGGVSWEDAELAGSIDAAGLRPRFHLLAPRADVAPLFCALDVATLSSRSEAFPNVLAEAMACGVPCVATDVGDARQIVGDTGVLVPRCDPAALADGWEHLLRLRPDARAALGAAARARIAERFAIAAIARRYEELYERLVAGDGAA